jgi:hypothetical protein
MHPEDIELLEQATTWEGMIFRFLQEGRPLILK